MEFFIFTIYQNYTLALSLILADTSRHIFKGEDKEDYFC